MKRFKKLGIIVALTSATTIFNLKMIEAKAASDVSIGYSAHVQNIGDKQRVYDGQLMGTEGKSFRLEGINIALINPISGMSIKYRVHIQNIGWTNWLSSNQYAGTKGQSLRIEAIEIKLEGAPGNYHVEYQAHVQDIGWQSWVKDGQTAGTTGQSKRVEALRVKLVNDNEVNTSSLGVKYQSEIQNIGLQDRMSNGEMTGTIGEGLRLEKINVSLENSPSGANITYRTHIEGRGWLGWVSGGTTTGAIGNDRRIEAIEIKANGLPNGYHVEYRAHVQDIGWQNWVRDGQTAGTTGQSKRIEALKIRIVKDEQPNNGGSNISYVYTNYNISLNDMVNIQLSREPALQMVNSNNQWEWRYAKITSDKQGYYYYPSANVTTFVEDANVYNIIKDQLILNLDSSLSRNTDTYKYQFLKLSYVEGTTAQQLNSLFRADGVLSGKGQVFIDAAKKYNVNPIYLASHAILETGNGTSALAKGIDVNGIKVYNLFGIGAIDSNPDGAGSQYAYSKGWTSIDLAIYGGAEFTSSSYINSSYKQDTIYKMRWNPDRPGVHQYATDVKWATNQVANIKKMFDQIPDAKLVFDIPVYK
ncbi:glucosaminidase domain-containing protein [Clostridium intestinale]|uniref:Beta-N-acetylglucosaminidase n=1 Tax=Clostridium intestinale URNW TaxID=1294142 RepID=U2NSD0_9CLOT|nr:glucosaminidase domain-containing protein [Clostridium intestinale]ERK32058.1 beta-N-acetylglucosaminidase [Clostridium intestinale URNW]